MCFSKKYNKKCFKKMQANNAKAMSACSEAIMALFKPKEVKPKIIPKGVGLRLARLAYTALHKLVKRIRVHTAKGPRPHQPKVQAPASAPPKAQGPIKAPQ
ncbi:60S ribosomal protein L29-like [Octodon degus]|uniref:60S ribosomal protein L29-like n=1 Tax=Octodon degus TaxID=10160 RepID=A0A6P3FI03_OCTDE|nr:60S ribosomal protein L29-like [Octodon degus]